MNILPFTICIFNCPPCVLYLAWPSINTTTFYFVNIYHVYVVLTSISYPTSLMTSFPLHLMAMALKLLLSFTSDSERMSSWRRKSVPTAAPAAAMLWRQVETRLDQAASGLQSGTSIHTQNGAAVSPTSPPPPSRYWTNRFPQLNCVFCIGNRCDDSTQSLFQSFEQVWYVFRWRYNGLARSQACIAC